MVLLPLSGNWSLVFLGDPEVPSWAIHEHGRLFVVVHPFLQQVVDEVLDLE